MQSRLDPLVGSRRHQRSQSGICRIARASRGFLSSPPQEPPTRGAPLHNSMSSSRQLASSASAETQVFAREALCGEAATSDLSTRLGSNFRSTTALNAGRHAA